MHDPTYAVILNNMRKNAIRWTIAKSALIIVAVLTPVIGWTIATGFTFTVVVWGLASLLLSLIVYMTEANDRFDMTRAWIDALDQRDHAIKQRNRWDPLKYPRID